MEQFFTFVTNNWLLWVGFFAVLFLLISHEFKARYGGAQAVTPQKAVQLMNHSKALVLDVRDTARFNESHIEGAMHIPLADIDQRLNKIKAYQDKPIVIISDLGASMTKSAKLLIEKGFNQCHILQGGLASWVDAGLPVAKSEKKQSAKKRK